MFLLFRTKASFSQVHVKLQIFKDVLHESLVLISSNFSLWKTSCTKLSFWQLPSKTWQHFWTLQLVQNEACTVTPFAEPIREWSKRRDRPQVSLSWPSPSIHLGHRLSLKQQFRARPPWKARSWTCEHKAFVRDLLPRLENIVCIIDCCNDSQSSDHHSNHKHARTIIAVTLMAMITVPATTIAMTKFRGSTRKENYQEGEANVLVQRLNVCKSVVYAQASVCNRFRCKGIFV